MSTSCRVWDIAAQRPLRKLLGHTAEVKGVSVTQDGDACVSCSTDCTVKLWKVPFAPGEAGPLLQTERPVFEFRGKGAFRGIDHHWGRNSFATAGPQVNIWDHERSEPVNSFTWGADSIMSVRFNPVSPDELIPPMSACFPVIVMHCLDWQHIVDFASIRCRPISFKRRPISFEVQGLTVTHEQTLQLLGRGTCLAWAQSDTAGIDNQYQ